MSVLTPSRRTSARLAIASAAAAAAVLLPQAAFAATVSISPSTNLADNDVVSVTGTGYVANGSYKVGICSKETYGIFGLPACATGVAVSATGSGTLNVNYTVTATNANAHASIPVVGLGQPSAFTCAGAGDDDCEIVITDHNGTSSTIVARQDISFS